MADGKGIRKMLLNAFTTDNKVKDGGGWSALLIPKKASALTVGLVAAGTVVGSAGKEALKTDNIRSLGKVSYSGGPARMTGQFTQGIVEGMNKASGGDIEIFSDMVQNVFDDRTINSKINNYGVTPTFVQALYGMGGQ